MSVHAILSTLRFGWADVFAGRPHTAAWWKAMCEDTCGARVVGEVRGGLEVGLALGVLVV
jgi:hypothetical protein